MSTVRWDPFENLGGLRRSMDRMFEELLLRSPRRPATTPVTDKEWAPPVEMFETNGEIVVRAELPDIDSRKVDITVTEDMITLRARRGTRKSRRNATIFAVS